MASPKPAVIVRREFLETPTIVSQQLRACIIGPSCQLVRYGVASEKGNGLAATVASLSTDSSAKGLLFAADTSFSFPNIASTSQLDASYVKVFAENALLTYANVADDSNPFTSDNNSVSFDSSAWRTNAAATRSASIPQDVAVGDTVQLYNTSDGLVHTSTVTGFTAAVVSAAVAQPAGTVSATMASATVPATVSASGLSFSITGANYLDGSNPARLAADPRIVGKLSTAYTVTVTAFNSTTSTMTISVVSDTGLDDKVATGVAVNGTVTLTSGLVLTAPAILTGLNVGLSGTFTVAMKHTARTVGSGLNVSKAAGATYTGTVDTTYIIACTKGGALLAGAPEFKVTTNNGADVPATFTISGTLQTVNIGSFGVQLQFIAATASQWHEGFVKGDIIRVTAQATSAGAIKTLVFADTYAGASNSVFKVRLSKKANVEIPQFRPASATANWVITNPLDASSRALTVKSQVFVRDASVVSGTVDLSVTAGKLYFQYRAYQALPRAVGSINSQSDITTQLGTIHPDNPLAYGVYKAFQNANGATVHYIPTVSQTLNGTRGFADALALSKGNRNCYSLVPLSTDPAVWAACNAQVQAESAATIGRFRVMWIAPEISSHFATLKLDPNGAIMFATSDAPSGGLVQINAVDAQGTPTNPQFATYVKVGDWVRTNFSVDSTGAETYNEYKVTAVLDNNSLQISGGLSFTALVNDRIEIFRDLTSAELAAQYVAVAGGFASERVFAVVPDRGINGLQVDGVGVKNYYIACAFAGLRSGSRPQQPLSNVELLGFDGISTVDQLFSEADLDVLRDGGVWAVRNTDDSRTYVERQLSTSVVDIYRKEQSITCNIDSMSFSVADGLKDLVGRVNITDQNLDTVRANLISILNQFQNATGSLTIGAQLRSYTIDQIFVPTTANDTVKAKITLVVPLPMNTIDITLVI